MWRPAAKVAPNSTITVSHQVVRFGLDLPSYSHYSVSSAVIDNRRNKRFDLCLPVELVRAGGEQISNHGETQNVSSSGVLFTSDARVDVGQPIEYLISLPLGPNREARVRLRCLGKVLRLQRSDSRPEPGPSSMVVAATMERYEFLRPKP